MTSDSATEAGVVASNGRLIVDEVFVDATILIADDHPPNLALLQQILNRAGAVDIHLTADPGAVVDLYQQLQPDIVLLDLHMPGMDGIAVIEALHGVTPDDEFIPVIVLTADSTSAARERVLSAGASDFLTKPVDRTEVVLRTRNLLHTRHLHRNVQDRNAALRREIEERTAIEREAALVVEEQRREILAVLESGAMRTVFQPIADLGSGRLVGYEALTRFDPEPIRPPDQWFDQAAALGLHSELELAAIDLALRQLPAIRDDVFVSINVSPAVATTAQFAQLGGRFPGDRLVVEVTEHARVDDYGTLLDTFDRLALDGARVAVDDAGAGFSSLQHILRLNPDIIKLDIALVRDIDRDPVKRALAASLVVFARDIGSTLVAEGIESAAEQATLVDLGIGWGQGYHLGRPEPLPGQAAASSG